MLISLLSVLLTTLVSDCHNINQILSKSEFFTINILEVSHEPPNNNDIILKEINIVLLLDKVTFSVKTRTTRMDYYYIRENYISPRAWMMI